MEDEGSDCATRRVEESGGDLGLRYSICPVSSAYRRHNHLHIIGMSAFAIQGKAKGVKKRTTGNELCIAHHWSSRVIDLAEDHDAWESRVLVSWYLGSHDIDSHRASQSLDILMGICDEHLYYCCQVSVGE